MKKFILILDDHLSEEDCYNLTKAIKQFNGVLDVYPQDEENIDNQINPLTSPPSNFQQNKSLNQQYTDNQYQQATNQNHQKQDLNNQQTNQSSFSQISDTNSRQAINYAIKYAVKNGLISTDEIKKMNPEKLVNYALKIIDQLPVSNKKELGQQISNVGEGESK